MALNAVKDAEPKEPTAVAKRRPNVRMGERGLALDTLDAMIRFAEGLIQGEIVPKGMKAGAVVGLIEAGKELGLAPMYALANLTFTNGRLGIMGDAAKALIRKSGTLEPGTDFVELYSGEEYTPDWTCTVTAHRKGQPKPFESSFSIGNAIAAKLIRLDGRKVLSRTREGFGDSGPWSTYTRRLLMYRALGFLVRDRFSDILGGATLNEELRDYQTERDDVTPPPEPDPLLATAQSQPDGDVIDAEVVEGAEPPPESPKPEEKAPEPPPVAAHESSELVTALESAAVALFGKSRAKADTEVSAATSGKIQSILSLSKATPAQLTQIKRHFEAIANAV